MRTTTCYSVKLKELRSISEKACIAIAYDGSEAIIPKSQIFGMDGDRAWWISAWILEQKDLQYSSKKAAVFNEDGEMMPNVKVHYHTPKKVQKIEDNSIEELKR